MSRRRSPLVQLMLVLVPAVSMQSATIAQIQGDVFVDGVSGSNASVGDTWATAVQTIDHAISIAQPDDEIWVKAYSTYIHYVPTATPAREGTFVLNLDAQLRGGFDGTEVFLSDRGTTLFDDTILSGDTGANSPGTTSDDAYHVLTITPAVDGGSVDGFRVVYGNADGTSLLTGESDRGAGVFTEPNGGGYMNMTFENLTVESCRAALFGAGMYMHSVTDSFASRVTVKDSLCASVSGGVVMGDGGGVYMTVCGEFNWFNSVFDGNRAVNGGGTFNIDAHDPVRFQNCQWVDNIAWRGGGHYVEDSNNGVLTHCTLAYNEASVPAGQSGGGSAIYIVSTTTESEDYASSVLWNNKTTRFQGGGNPPLLSKDTVFATASTLGIVYSCIELDAIPVPPNPYPGWFNTGCIAADPLFTNGSARLLTLQSGSPCLDKADDRPLLQDEPDLDGNGNRTEFTPVDLANATREIDTAGATGGMDGGNFTGVGRITDMGAYERQ